MNIAAQDDAAYVQSERPSPHVLLIRFTRSAKRNALSNPMVLELARLLVEAQHDNNTRAVVITGDDAAFSAGADLKNMQKGGVTAVVNDPKRAATSSWQAETRNSVSPKSKREECPVTVAPSGCRARWGPIWPPT